MNYYIKGDAAKADQINAAFKKLGYDTSGHIFNANSVLYFTLDGEIMATTCNCTPAIIKTHPDYKELELPIEPKFKKGETIKSDSGSWVVKEVDVENQCYVVNDGWIEFKLQDHFNLVETQPKFKVGDWIVQNDKGAVSQITKTINGKDENGEYRAYWHTNGYFAACFENEYHLWTIADAKDGDVLVTTKISSCPFIYRKTTYPNNFAYYYAGIDGNGDFCEGCLKMTSSHFGPVSDVSPATKEQRELLFKKMKVAGYEWDADKKELKKIKHYDISSFYAGMPVLVRDSDEHKWLFTIFGIYNKDNLLYPFVVVNMRGYEQCIPFEGNEHLLGTTDMCDEQYINW